MMCMWRPILWGSFLWVQALWAEPPSELVKEYAVALIPDVSCTLESQRLTEQLSRALPELLPVENIPHVTLYHAAYREADLSSLIRELSEWKLSKIRLDFEEFQVVRDRWVDWNLARSPSLQALHETVLSRLAPLRQRVLQRAQDAYEGLSEDQRSLVDRYGSWGVAEAYHPHLTLFYVYPPNERLREASEVLLHSAPNRSCGASFLGLFEVGYNGNLLKEVFLRPIPD